jgi:DNA-binding transcriptional LysR family regulator
MHQDLNDLFFFAHVAEFGGFAPAGRALGVSKSLLSRRVAALEDQLGVRLLQRNSRNFTVTEIGQVYLRHCQAMLTEANSAREAIDHFQAEPRGQLRFSCPILLAQTVLSIVLPEFMQRYPLVSVMMDVTNRRVDVVEEGYDLALRVRTVMEDSNLAMRSFAQGQSTLVGSPDLLARHGTPQHPNDLARFPTLSITFADNRYTWRLTGPQDEAFKIEHTPRLLADDYIVIREAAIGGIGLASIPDYLINAAVKSGRLVHVLPDWSFAPANLHAVFPTRRGLVPAVRVFIDFLAQRLPEVALQYSLEFRC